ncbi:aminoglycoside phosphotransferase family protein [Curtobacterium sp. MCPF17_002]|uniref:phosphotransferase family protein n=1 Tax=Curtobacterium sp. MCPF17_002 TaxID=2175645 RepID=UPI0021AC81B3|nr:aminoglycoside phosphotransferase family protein [Curtobacterium sp. MCPF17_002]WIB77615.1 aminoglycoside phosphotransferase family protein [Curtobacterium sp. MCPF17_002]
MLQPTTTALVDAAAGLLGRPLTLARELTGGQHARTLLVDDGDAHVVVRMFPRADDSVARELEVLRRLGPLGRLAPRALAHGELEGHGVIVTEAVPGGPPSPTLDPVVIGEQLGVALAAVHRLDPTGLPDDAREPTTRAGRLAASAQEAWREADLDRVLTHGDFWSGNTVWDGDRLTGVVDWSGARSAPRGVDLAWCRQDLVLLGSPVAAERFLAAYEAASGRRVLDVHAWDVVAAARADTYVETWAPNYAGIGRPEVDARVLRERFDAWVGALIGSRTAR